MSDARISRHDSEIPIIILLGQTGAGKSHFINMADPGLEIKAATSDKIMPCTQEVGVFEVQNRRAPSTIVRLVDTPGFNDPTTTNDDKHLKMIIKWLKKGSNTHVAGILYLHEIIPCRAEESPTVVKPQDIPRPPGVFVVTTKWSMLAGARARGETRETELRDRFHVPIRRFDNTTESTWEIIHAVLSSSSNMKKKDVAKALRTICLDRPNMWQDAIERMSNFFANLFQT